jgi:hypothetical protein
MRAADWGQGVPHEPTPTRQPARTWAAAASSRGPGAKEAPAFPRVDAAAAGGLVAGDADRVAAHRLRVLDLDEPVAEDHQVRARDAVGGDQALDHPRLARRLVVLEGPVDVRAEVAGDVEQVRLLPHLGLVAPRRAAEEQAPPGREGLEHRPRAPQKELVGPAAAAAEVLAPRGNVRQEPPRVLRLVGPRVEGRPAELADALRQADHLVHRLLAGGGGHVLGHEVAHGLARQARRQGREHLDHHRHHDVGPALADQGQRAVEVEQDEAEAAARGGADHLEGLMRRFGHRRFRPPGVPR